MGRRLYLLLSIVYGGMLASTGINKLLPKQSKILAMPEMLPEAKKTIRALVESGWIWDLVGITQIIGGLILIHPRLRALGSIILLPVNIGIFLFHVIEDAPERIPMTVVILVINLLFIYIERRKYKPLFY